MGKTWDELKKERMPDLETNPGKYPSYFEGMTKLNFGRQLTSALRDAEMNRYELEDKLRTKYPNITEGFILKLETGFTLPELEIIQSIVWILKADLNLTFYHKSPYNSS